MNNLLTLVVDGKSQSLADGATSLTLGNAPAATVYVAASKPYLLTLERSADILITRGEPALPDATLNSKTIQTLDGLQLGDTLSIAGTLVTLRQEGKDLELIVDTRNSQFMTAPPEVEQVVDSSPLVAANYQRQRDALGQVEKSSNGWRYAVAVALLLLAATAATLFTAQSVRLETIPAQPDQVSISGGWMKIAVGDRYLLRPGVHDVRLQTKGYKPLQSRFELGSEEPLTIRLVQEPLPGSVEIVSTPIAGANVVFQGEARGVTPLRLDGVAPGTYALSLQAEGYLPWHTEIEVSGRDLTDRLDAELIPASGLLQLTTEPSGATVYTGETALGTTLDAIRVPEGRQTLSVVLEGYKPVDVDIEMLANSDVTLDTIVLEKADGTLRVSTRPSGANVTVDGKYRGQSPVTLALAPGQNYLLQFSKSGYGRVSRSVSVAAATGEELLVDLAARTGDVTLDIRPNDAEVRINGRLQPADKRRFGLPASPQRIDVRRAGYERWIQTVTPRPGFPQRVAVRLRTGDEVRVAGIDPTITTKRGPVLRYVDGGEFLMGASRREPGRRANETLRKVKITKGFYIGTREITNAEFRLFNAKHDSSSTGPVTLAGDKNPVVNISWQEAAAYCNWLSDQEGLTLVYADTFGKLTATDSLADGYRLPTEAEWTWAARYQGGKGELKFPWGKSMPPAKESGNYADASAVSLVPTLVPGYDDGYAATAPVASFKANRAGLYDFGGNVAEWVHDYYQVYTPDSARVWVDPVGPTQARHNVIRGAGWRSSLEGTLRFSYRDFGMEPRSDVGFRIARNMP